VSSDQIGKGYEVAKNEYLIMDDAELEAIQLESGHTIEIDQFVPFTQIDKSKEKEAAKSPARRKAG
jgi:DNA end-binding protein Ku